MTRAVERYAVSTGDPLAAVRWRAFLILFGCLVCVGMGQSLMFAILPPVARNLGLSEVQVGLIFATSAVLWVLASPVWGRCSDRWGRRPVILVGLAGYSVSMSVFGICVQLGLGGYLALLPLYLLMISARAIFGLFGSATVPAAQGYVADRTGLSERATYLAKLGAAFGLGVMLGPGLVALLLGIGLVAPFYGVALLGVVSTLVIALWLPERVPAFHQARAVRRMSPLDPRIWPFLLVGISLGVAQSGTLQTVGFFAIDALGLSLEYSAKFVGYALTGSAGAGLITQLVVIPLWRPQPRAMILMGLACGAICYGMLAVADGNILVFAALVTLGFGFGLVRTGAAVGASVSVGRDEQGGVAGMMNTTGAIGVVFAPFVGMPLYQIMPQAPYLLYAIINFSALLFVLAHPTIRQLATRVDAELETGVEPPH